MATEIVLQPDENDASLALRLRHLSPLTEIHFRLGLLNTTTDWNEAQNALLAQQHLEKIQVSYLGFRIFMRSDSLAASAVFCRHILHAIPAMHSLQEVELYSMDISTHDLVLVLQSGAPALSSLTLTGGEIQNDTTAGSLETAMRGNTTITTLHLRSLGDSAMAQFLASLKSNANVKALTLGMHGCAKETTFRAAQEFLESNSTVEKVGFLHVGRGVPVSPVSFQRSLLHGLTRNTSATEIRISGSWFNNQSELFERLLASTPKLHRLSIDDMDDSASRNLLETHLLKPKSLLRVLELNINSTFNLSKNRLRSLLLVVASSRLETLAFGDLTHYGQLQALACVLRHLKLKELNFGVGRDLRVLMDEGYFSGIKSDLLDGLKANYVLESFPGNLLFAEDAGFFASVDSCLFRNKRLAEWIDNPETLPPNLWRKAFDMAWKGGDEMRFRALRAVLPSFDKSKRKRSSSADDSDAPTKRARTDGRFDDDDDDDGNRKPKARPK